MALLSATALTLTGWGLARATTSAGLSTIAFMGIDTNVSGNTATKLGPLDTCVQVAAGDTLTVDVTANAVPSDRPATAFGAELNYDPAFIRIEGWDPKFLLASQSLFQPIDQSDAVPDTDGIYLMAIIDTSGNNETGPGVLARVSLKALKAGVSTLTLSTRLNDGVLDDTSVPIQALTLGTAKVSAGQACPSPQPSPVITTVNPDGSSPDGGTPDNGVPGDDGTPDGDSTTPGPDSTASSDQTPGPGAGAGVGGVNVGATATAAATATATAAAGQESGDSDDDDDGFPVWVLAPIALGVLGAAAGGYVLWRRSRASG